MSPRQIKLWKILAHATQLFVRHIRQIHSKDNFNYPQGVLWFESTGHITKGQ